VKGGAVGTGEACGRAEIEVRKVLATSKVDVRNCILTRQYYAPRGGGPEV